MTLIVYQKSQVAMLVDAECGRRFARRDFGNMTEELTFREQERLCAQATDAGMLLCRKLHEGWRLTKLLTLLPMTFRVGDPEALSDLVARYWHENLPQGLYFEAEAADFAVFVAARTPSSSLISEVASVEGAILAVGARQRSSSPRSIHLQMTRDPRQLLRCLSQDHVTHDVPLGAFSVTVTADETGFKLRVLPSVGEPARLPR